MAKTAAQLLWEEAEPQPWQDALDGYWAAVRGREAGEKKRKGLGALDRFFQEELPAALRARTPAALTKEELVKLVCAAAGRAARRGAAQAPQRLHTAACAALRSWLGTWARPLPSPLLP